MSTELESAALKHVARELVGKPIGDILSLISSLVDLSLPPKMFCLSVVECSYQGEPSIIVSLMSYADTDKDVDRHKNWIRTMSTGIVKQLDLSAPVMFELGRMSGCWIARPEFDEAEATDTPRNTPVD